MKNIFASLFCICFSLALFGQGDRAALLDRADQLANSITSGELERHLTILASDEMEGRETGQPGQRLAAQYLAEIVASYNLPAIGDDGTYFQRISYISERWDQIECEINGEALRHLWDFYALPSQNKDRAATSINEVTFLGYGIEDQNYNDYRRAGNLNGKTVLILSGEPLDKNGDSHITGSKEMSPWSSAVEMKLKAAKAHGVETVLIIDADFQKNLSSARKISLDSRMHIGWSENPEDNYANSLYLSPETAKTLIGEHFDDVVTAREKINRKGKSRPVSFPVDLNILQQKNVKELLGENVLAYVEGSDPVLKDELLIVTAHYDHIGRRGTDIFNGADDNGSGTSTVLEVCQAFVEATRKGWGSKRSVLFMWVSGEEKGLLGSKYYVENPIFPLENTIADINVDMVGRVDDDHADNPNYIYVIGADRLSTELHEINEAANTQYTQLELDYTYNEESDPNRYYYRSDHYNFAEKGIPAIFYFNGTHDDYHQHTDTVDKINFEKMTRIGRLIFHTAWELANRDKRIEVDVIQQD